MPGVGVHRLPGEPAVLAEAHEPAPDQVDVLLGHRRTEYPGPRLPHASRWLSCAADAAVVAAHGAWVRNRRCWRVEAGAREGQRRTATWLESDGEKTLGSLIALFEEKSFAILFVVLLGVPALPLPTGGATHVFEIIAVLLAAQLIAGRDEIWLPQRWRTLELAGDKQQRFITGLMKLIRRLERISKPRLRFLFDHRLSNIVFGVLVIAGCIGAFFAPPFTGLDTLPALAVVLLSLAVLLQDFALVVAALVVGIAGVVLEIVLGAAAVNGIGSLF